MRCIFNPLCCIIQGGTQLQEYASRYPDRAVSPETRTVISCGSRECCLPAELTEACQWQGHVCFIWIESCGEAHAITRELVGHQNSLSTPKLIHFTNQITRLWFCTPVVRITGKRHLLDLLMFYTTRLYVYFENWKPKDVKFYGVSNSF